MIRRRLKDFFMNRHENSKILELLHSDELSLIERFLSAAESDRKQYLAAELMERTLYRIDPRSRVFLRLFEVESEKLASMEKGAPYIREEYRGHYIHSVYNYLMGFFLFQGGLLEEEYLNCLNLDYFDGHYRERPVYDEYVVSRSDEGKEFQRRWALTAFFHDMAYLSQVNLQVMEDEGKRLTHLDSNPYSLAITDLQSFLTIPLMSKIKAKVKMSFAPVYLFSEDSLEILAYRMVNRLGRFSRNLIYQSLKERIITTLKQGRFDHGLMGAVFLLQEFYSLIHSFFVDGEKSDIPHVQKFSINRNIIRFTDAMAAVSLHHIAKFKSGIFQDRLKVKIRNHKMPLLFLLILCDELQAWDRELPPPGEHTRMAAVRVTRNKRPDKNMFTDHYKDLYREYAALEKSARKEKDMGLTFIVPSWKGDDDDTPGEKHFFICKKKYVNQIKKILDQKKEKIITEDEYIKELRKKRDFEIKITGKSLYYIDRWVNDHSEDPYERKIAGKISRQLGKDAWESFKKEHKTLGLLIELAVDVKTFLACHDRAPLDENNAVARGLEILAEDILPKLKWLKKGQDILTPFLRPYHFHDIVVNKEENGNTRESPDESRAPGAAGGTNKEYCRLVLRYPGEEVDDIERIIKKRIAGMLSGREKKEITLKYPDAPGAGLNRTINEIYIPKIEEYLYGIQRGEFIVVQINGGKNGSK